jgi:hypothetical protein
MLLATPTSLITLGVADVLTRDSHVQNSFMCKASLGGWCIIVSAADSDLVSSVLRHASDMPHLQQQMHAFGLAIAWVMFMQCVFHTT